MASSDWRTVTFQELLDEALLEIGDGYRAKNKELGEGGPLFLRAGHVTDTHIDFEGVEFFHSHLTEKVRPKMACPGDTIVTTKGNSTGRTSFVTDRMPPFVYSPHLSYWRTLNSKRLVGGFLRYWSRGREFHRQLSGMKASTDMAPYLSLTDQRRLKITLPPPATQKAIARILGTLDDKIELNRQMNETLEATARALFKSWFVDFDPVRAKMDGQKPLGMDEETAKLFPDGFEESELGPIPKGWRIQTLQDLTSAIGSGATPRGGSKVYVDEGVALVRSQNVYDCEFRWGGLARITPEAAEALAGVTLEPDDVLLNITGASILRTCVVDPGVLPARVNQHVARIRARDPVPSRFLHLHLVRREMKENLMGLNAGATREAVTKGHLQSIRLAAPPDGVYKSFDTIVRPIYTLKQSNLEETRALAALRDTLLPKLLSGEIRVGEAEKLAEEVA